MQSSFNVFKNTSVKHTGSKEIVTSAEISSAVKAEIEANSRDHIESYENLAKNILENARKQSEQMVARAYQEARSIEEAALSQAEQLRNNAYEEGFSQGQQEGFNKAYFDTIEKAKAEGEDIIASAEALLKDAKQEYEAYVQRKSVELNELIVTIAKTVIKREVENSMDISNMIYDALENSKNSQSFIIRCNEKHVEDLKQEINNWKEQLGFFGEIFVLKDESIEPGNALIDKGNGKIEVGINYALQRVRDILEGKD